jgi:hypothetical protein
MPLERIEPTGPVGAVRLQPGVEFHERLRTESIQPPLRVSADFHQTRVAQHLQVPGDTRLMHPDSINEVIDRALAVSNSIEDATPGRFGDHVQDVKSGGHLLNIRFFIYMRNCILRYLGWRLATSE